MSKYYKVIHSIEEIGKFYNEVLPRLQPLEVYFVSLSARNKYLTKQEMEFYDLGRTEMFAKTVIRKDSFEDYLKHIYRFECNEEGFLTRNSFSIPSKTFVCYANICPSSTVQVINKFQNLLSEYTTEALQIVSNSLHYGNFVNRMNKIDNNLLNFYQNSHTSKKWLDIDIDLLNTKTSKDIRNIKESLEEFDFDLNEVLLVETKSGFHVLLKKIALKKNPKDLIKILKNSLETKEVDVNKNEMIPLPGTYQADFKVKFIDF